MARSSKNKEAAIGSQNRTVGPNEAKSALTHCIKLQRPIMMWGAPGIGKSDIVKQIADAEGREVIDIRLPLWEPTDIKGIPYYNSKENNMVWASPAELPTDPKSKAIVFLDELNSAAPAVQAAAYQLILNRRVGQYHLPEGGTEAVEQFRSGFYYLSKGLNIPYVPVEIDFGNRRFKIQEPQEITGTFEEESEKLIKLFEGVEGATRTFKML